MQKMPWFIVVCLLTLSSCVVSKANYDIELVRVDRLRQDSSLQVLQYQDLKDSLGLLSADQTALYNMVQSKEQHIALMADSLHAQIDAMDSVIVLHRELSIERDLWRLKGLRMKKALGEATHALDSLMSQGLMPQDLIE